MGIEVPKTALVPIEEIEGLPSELKFYGQQAFAIQRFDRSANSEEKIHIEDLAQVFSVYPEQKYTTVNYRTIAAFLWKETKEAGIVEFLKRFVFNVLIGNGDMHLKNWSLIYRQKNRAELSPAYDFLSTLSYIPEERLALNFIDDNDFRLSLGQFKRFAAKAQLPEKLVIDTVQETVEVFAKAWKTADDLPLPEEVRKAISNHLKSLPFVSTFSG